MAAQVAAGGQTRSPSGAGPGAGRPNRRSSSRQVRNASRPTTFCSSTAGTSASSTRPDRPMRPPACRKASSRSSGWAGRKSPGRSRAPSRSGSAVQHPVRAGPPGPGPHPGAGPGQDAACPRPAGGHAEGGRARRGERGPPDRAVGVGAEGRVAAAVPVHAQEQAGVQRERRQPVPAESLRAPCAGTRVGRGSDGRGGHGPTVPGAAVSPVRRRSRTAPTWRSAPRPARPAGRDSARCRARSAPCRR